MFYDHFYVTGAVKSQQLIAALNKIIIFPLFYVVWEYPFVINTSWVLLQIQPDAKVCRYLFTAKSLYMFRVSQHPSSGVLKTVTAASSTGHNTGTATSLQRGPVCRYLFTAKSLYMFRVSQHPSSLPCFPPTWPDEATLEGSSCTSIMTCTGGCGYSF